MGNCRDRQWGGLGGAVRLGQLVEHAQGGSRGHHGDDDGWGARRRRWIILRHGRAQAPQVQSQDACRTERAHRQKGEELMVLPAIPEHADLAGRLVADGCAQVPEPEHESHGAARSQLGHHRETDGGEAELSQGDHEIAGHQPERADTALIAADQGGDDHHTAGDCGEDHADSQLGGGRRLLVAVAQPAEKA